MQSLIFKKDSVMIKPQLIFFIGATAMILLSPWYPSVGILGIWTCAAHGLVCYSYIADPVVAGKYDLDIDLIVFIED